MTSFTSKEESISSKPTRHYWRLLGLLAGLGFFYYTIEQFGGFYKVLSHLGNAWRSLPWVLANTAAGMLLFTRAWERFLPPTYHQKHFFSLFRIKICGEAVNFLTPLGFMAGDPVRVLLLRKYVGPGSHLRSVVIDRVMHSMAAHVFCLFGLALLLFQPIAFPQWLSVSLFVFYTVTTFLIAKLIRDLVGGKGLGYFELIFHWHFLNRRFPSLMGRLAELRDDFAYYADKPRAPIWESFFLHFLGRILAGVEIGLIVYFAHGPATLTFCLILASLTSFFSASFGFIPGALGVLEALYAHFFRLYGFSPEMGIAIQLVRRLRVAFFVLVGIAILDFREILEVIRKMRIKSS